MGIRTKVRNWVYEKRDKERCGLFPAQTGKWDPFLNCCKAHDIAYTYARKEALAGGRALAEIEVKFSDREFASCVRKIAKNSFILKRPSSDFGAKSTSSL